VLPSPVTVKREVVGSDLLVGGRHVYRFSVWRLLLDSSNRTKLLIAVYR
jgi:hypothetical protein